MPCCSFTLCCHAADDAVTLDATLMLMLLLPPLICGCCFSCLCLPLPLIFALLTPCAYARKRAPDAARSAMRAMRDAICARAGAFYVCRMLPPLSTCLITPPMLLDAAIDTRRRFSLYFLRHASSTPPVADAFHYAAGYLPLPAAAAIRQPLPPLPMRL